VIPAVWSLKNRAPLAPLTWNLSPLPTVKVATGVESPTPTLPAM